MSQSLSQKKSAWLIMWEGSSDNDLKIFKRPRIVAILDFRISESSVKKYLKILYYSDRNLAPSEKNDEMYLQSVRRRNNPRWRDVEGSDGNWQFGVYSPWLKAIRVSNLIVLLHNDNHETTYWSVKDAEGKLYDFKLETHLKDSVFIEQIFHGIDAAPP